MSGALTDGSLLDRLRLPLMLVGVSLVLGASQFEATRPLLARGLALGVPVAAVAYGVLPLNHSHPALRLGAFALAGALVVLSAGRAWSSLEPAQPLLHERIGPGQRVVLPAHTGAELLIEVAARVEAGRSSGSYRLRLTRGDASELLEGELSAAATAVDRRHAPSIRHEVSLSGGGAPSLALEQAQDLMLPVALTVNRAPFGAGWLFPLLWLLCGAALALQLAARRRGLRARFAAGAAAAVGFSFELARRAEASRGLESVISALLVALLCGIIVLALGAMLTRLVRAPG